MKIGYLVNTYPVTSGTFIRREIHALEALGLEVERYSIRRWDQALADPADQAEQARTHYLLSGRALVLVTAFLGELVRNPAGVVRALGTLIRLIRNAGGGIVRHAAYLMEAASLKQHAARQGVGHIHAHFSTNPAAVALLSHRMGGPRYSFTVHGPDELLDPTANSTALKVDQAAFVVAITHFCRMTLVLAAGMAAWDKIHIVRCGLDLSEFEPAPPTQVENKTLVCVGRLCPQKGQVLIPGAVAELVARHPDLKVVLIGDGESRPAIVAEIARLGLEDRIELAGWATNAEVRARIAGARALMLPSFAEGLPIVLMEAFALQRPVITTYIAGIPELIDASCGWLVPASDQQALITALDACLSATPQDLAAMGAEGRRRVEASHDQIANARQLKALFA
ncbi:MAG: glycosyltransferase [Pseudomonadota bacterium]